MCVLVAPTDLFGCLLVVRNLCVFFLKSQALFSRVIIEISIYHVKSTGRNINKLLKIILEYKSEIRGIYIFREYSYHGIIRCDRRTRNKTIINKEFLGILLKTEPRNLSFIQNYTKR